MFAHAQPLMLASTVGNPPRLVYFIAPNVRRDGSPSLDHSVVRIPGNSSNDHAALACVETRRLSAAGEPRS